MSLKKAHTAKPKIRICTSGNYKILMDPTHPKGVEAIRTELLRAISSGNYDIAKLLLENVDKGRKIKVGADAIIIMARTCTPENEQKSLMFLDFLLECGIDIENTDIFGKSAYDYADENGLIHLKKRIVFETNVREFLALY